MTHQSDTLYCAIHPKRETSLRCNRCEKPICSKCAIHTPTGYRCKECINTQQKIFETAKWHDYVLGFTLAAVLSYLGSLIVPRLGFFVFFLSPLAGGIIAEVARFVTRRRRSKKLHLTISAGALLGSLPPLLMQFIPAFFFFSQAGMDLSFLFSGLYHGVYLIMVTTTVYSRVSGLVFNR